MAFHHGGFHGGGIHHGGFHHGGIHHGGIHHGGIHHGGIHHGGIHHGGIHHGGIYHGGIHHGGIHHGGIHHGGIHHGGIHHGGFNHGSAFTTGAYRTTFYSSGTNVQCNDNCCPALCPAFLRIPVLVVGLATFISACVALGTTSNLSPEAEAILDTSDSDAPDTPGLVDATKRATTFVIVWYLLTAFWQIAAIIVRCIMQNQFSRSIGPRFLPLFIADAVAVAVFAVGYFIACGLAANLVPQWKEWVDYTDFMFGILDANFEFSDIYRSLVANAVTCAITGLLLLVNVLVILIHLVVERKKLCSCFSPPTETSQEVTATPSSLATAPPPAQQPPPEAAPTAPAPVSQTVVDAPVPPSAPEVANIEPIPPPTLPADPPKYAGKSDLRDEAPPSYHDLYGT